MGPESEKPNLQSPVPGKAPKRALRALIVEDSSVDALLLVALLKHEGYLLEYRQVDTAMEMEDALRNQIWDIIFSDHSMPNFSSTDALAILNKHKLDIPFIIVSGTIDDETAVESMKAGASDYIIKGNLKRLIPAIDRELKEVVDRRKRKEAEKELLAKEEELKIARNIQKHFFPTTAPAVEGFEIAGVSHPASVTGGDYFDYIHLQDGRTCVVVGDVTGHGLGPALLMSEARECLRTLSLTTGSLREILTRADQLLSEDFGGDRFISLILAKILPEENKLEYINAGNPSAYVIDPDGKISQELKAMCPVLGLSIGLDFAAPEQVILRPGDLVLFMSDGVLEAESPEGGEFGVERALECVRENRKRPAIEIVDELCNAVHRFHQGEEQEDDITAVVIKKHSA